MALEQQLQSALDCDELFMQCQPKIDLASGALAGYEALQRWRHPQHGVVPPEEFVPIIEETGRLSRLATVSCTPP